MQAKTCSPVVTFTVEGNASIAAHAAAPLRFRFSSALLSARTDRPIATWATAAASPGAFSGGVARFRIKFLHSKDAPLKLCDLPISPTLCFGGYFPRATRQNERWEGENEWASQFLLRIRAISQREKGIHTLRAVALLEPRGRCRRAAAAGL